MRFSARRHERRRLLTRSDRASTTSPCRRSTSASRPCRLKSHGSRRREAPNKHLSVPPPPFLSSTSRAEAREPSLPCLIPRFLCESAHGYHRSEETDIIGASRRSSARTMIEGNFRSRITHGQREEPYARSAYTLRGGQTGVDRAALDAAVLTGRPYEGWCPKRRMGRRILTSTRFVDEISQPFGDSKQVSRTTNRAL
jgi:Circularly permutated YpsA SLOG family